MRCSRCKRSEPDVVFTSKTSGYCKECFRDYRRERYVPVAKDAEQKRKKDTAWGARHDAKTCTVCQRNGGVDVIFRSLTHKRCSACMTKGLYRCPKHGVSRKKRCSKCHYATIKARAARRRQENFQDAKDKIFLVNGDGTCARCNTNIRINGKLDRAHHCE